MPSKEIGSESNFTKTVTAETNFNSNVNTKYSNFYKSGTSFEKLGSNKTKASNSPKISPQVKINLFLVKTVSK